MKKRIITMMLAMGVSAAMSITAFAGSWAQDGVNWKYYDDNGKTVTSDWVSYNNSWYYVDGAGSMMTGWVKVDKNWYFLHDDGTMAHSTWIDNYYVNESGKWTESR